MNDKIEEVRTAIRLLLFKMGFREAWVQFQYTHPNGETGAINYTLDNLYCGIIFLENLPDTSGVIKDWAFIEYADSLHEAKLHMYHDGDMIPVNYDLSQLLIEIKKEIRHSIKTVTDL